MAKSEKPKSENEVNEVVEVVVNETLVVEPSNALEHIQK